MPGTVVGKKLNYGYPGQVSRHGDEVSRTFPIKKGSKDVEFGMPVALNSDGTVELFGASKTAADFAGIAMRRVKTALEWPYQSKGYYRPEEPCDVLERGSMTVECKHGTPKVGGDVYVYNQGDKYGFAADNDSSHCVKLEGVRWASDADSRGVAEIVLLTRHGI